MCTFNAHRDFPLTTCPGTLTDLPAHLPHCVSVLLGFGGGAVQRLVGILVHVIHSDTAVIAADCQQVGVLWVELQRHDACGTAQHGTARTT